MSTRIAFGDSLFTGTDAAEFTRLSNEARAHDRAVRGWAAGLICAGPCPRPEAF